MTFPIAEGAEPPAVESAPGVPGWQRWNDYGIGLLLEGRGAARGELRQAAAAFAEVESLGRCDGPLNAARVHFTEGRLDEAVAALARLRGFDDPPAPPWTVAWLTGLVNRQQGHLAAAEENFRQVLTPPTEEMIRRGFDFRADYEVINQLGMTLFDRAKQQFGDAQRTERDRLLSAAGEQFERTLAIDAENVTAHFNLSQIYQQLGRPEQAAEHRRLHEIYKPDDNARDRAIAAARKKYPAANHAAEAVVIYPLQPHGRPRVAAPDRR